MLKKITLLLLAAACLLPTAQATQDSTSVFPVNPVPLSKKTSSVDANVTNERYSLLQDCPIAPVCEDENGTLPAGATKKDCPAACTRIRMVFGPNPNGSFSRSVDAVCPANYVQTASFNVKDELAWMDRPQSVFPIPIDKWRWYLQNGYTCSWHDAIQTDTVCARSTRSIENVRDVRSEGANLSINPDKPVNIGGNAGSWIKNNTHSPSASSACYLWNAPMSCKIDVGHCSGVVGEILDRKYFYPYALYECRPPAGIYRTGRQVPVSIVCVHRKVKWEPSFPANPVPSNASPAPAAS